MLDESKMRLCEVDGKIGWFHGFTQLSHIVPPSNLRGGHGGGVVAGAYAIIERQDGTVSLIEAQKIKFLRTPAEFIDKTEKEEQNV